jgi:hypothetical protein
MLQIPSQFFLAQPKFDVKQFLCFDVEIRRRLNPISA